MKELIDELEGRLESARKEEEVLRRITSKNQRSADVYMRSLEGQLAEARKREHR
jgi:hypothetical protein